MLVSDCVFACVFVVCDCVYFLLLSSSSSFPSTSLRRPALVDGGNRGTREAEQVPGARSPSPRLPGSSSPHGDAAAATRVALCASRAICYLNLLPPLSSLSFCDNSGSHSHTHIEAREREDEEEESREREMTSRLVSRPFGSRVVVDLLLSSSSSTAMLELTAVRAQSADKPTNSAYSCSPSPSLEV